MSRGNPMPRLCRDCGTDESKEPFRGTGLTCRECENARNRKHYAENRDRINEATKRYKKSEGGRAANKLWRENNRDKMRFFRRRSHIRKAYGIDTEDFEKMKLEQGNKCYICGSPPKIVYSRGKRSGIRQELHIDHDHKTGKIRKLLCNKCNSMIGLSMENVDLLEKAILYLKEHGEQN